jgi:hypothetical protein
VIASLRDADNNTHNLNISNISSINNLIITVDSSNEINGLTTTIVTPITTTSSSNDIKSLTTTIIPTIITTSSSNDINGLTTTISGGSTNSDQQVSTLLSEHGCHALLP